MTDLAMGYIAHEHHGFARVLCQVENGVLMLDDDIELESEEHHRAVEAMALEAGIDHHSPMPLDSLPPDLRDALVVGMRWPGRTIPYELPFGLDDRKEDPGIDEAMKMWEATELFRFEPNTPATGWVAFNRDSGCNSTKGLGRPEKGGPVDVNLTEHAPAGVIAHEIGHALGLPHEHKRRDAQSYLEFRWGPIVTARKEAQYATRLDALKVGYYDYGSIMHYSRAGDSDAAGDRQTSDSDGDRLRPFDRNARLGQREGLAMSDLNAAAAIYAEGVRRIDVGLGFGSDGCPGAMFLGIGGREFRLQPSGSTGSFVLGEGAPVADPHNDPASPPLSTSYVLGLPVYLRFAGQTPESACGLETAKVTLTLEEIHDDAFPGKGKLPKMEYRLPHATELGPARGRRVHLERQATGDFQPRALSQRKITRIECRLVEEVTGGSGSLFLGIGGRELPLTSPTQHFGEAELAGLTEGHVQEFPAYLRADDTLDCRLQERSDSEIVLTVEGGASVHLAPALTPVSLNAACGTACQLRYRQAPRHHSYSPSEGNVLPPSVRQVRVSLNATGGNPGVDDPLYLGLGGREFRLRLATGEGQEFVLGRGANVRDAEANNPAASAAGARLSLLDVDTHPAYLRQQGEASWTLISADVTVLFEGPCGQEYFWGTGSLGSRIPSFDPGGPDRKNPPMAVELTAVNANLPIGGAAGHSCALVRTHPR